MKKVAKSKSHRKSQIKPQKKSKKATVKVKKSHRKSQKKATEKSHKVKKSHRKKLKSHKKSKKSCKLIFFKSD